MNQLSGVYSQLLIMTYKTIIEDLIKSTEYNKGVVEDNDLYKVKEYAVNYMAKVLHESGLKVDPIIFDLSSYVETSVDSGQIVIDLDTLQNVLIEMYNKTIN